MINFGVEYAKYSGSKSHIEYVRFETLDALARGLRKLPFGLKVSFYVIDKFEHSKSMGNFKVADLLNTLKKLPA